MQQQEQAIPELRFTGFDGDWKKSALGSLANFSSGGTPSKENQLYWNGEIPWISAASMHEDIIDSSELRVTKLGAKNGTKLASKGSILLLVRGSMLFNRIPAGICIRDVTFNQDVKALKLNKGISPQFIMGLIRAKEHRLLSLVTETGIGAGKLDTPDLKKFLIYVPSLPEQQKIASFLESVDEKIAKLQKKKDLLETYKKGCMQKLFSQELRFKDDEGKDFPDWEEKQLKKIVSFSKGKGISKSDISENAKIPCIRYGEVYTIYSERITSTVSHTNLNSSDLILSVAGDVIIPASGEDHLDMARACCVEHDDIALGGDLNILRGAQNGVFLAYYLNNAKKKNIARLAQGVSVVHLYGQQLKELTVLIPYIDEQKKIADFLSALDDKITLVSEELDKAKIFKKGLLQQMFV